MKAAEDEKRVAGLQAQVEAAQERAESLEEQQAVAEMERKVKAAEGKAMAHGAPAAVDSGPPFDRIPWRGGPPHPATVVWWQLEGAGGPSPSPLCGPGWLARAGRGGSPAEVLPRTPPRRAPRPRHPGGLPG